MSTRHALSPSRARQSGVVLGATGAPSTAAAPISSAENSFPLRDTAPISPRASSSHVSPGASHCVSRSSSAAPSHRPAARSASLIASLDSAPATSLSSPSSVMPLRTAAGVMPGAAR